MVATAYVVAQQIEALIVLANPNYVIQGWHGTLFSIAITGICILCNTWLLRQLPLLENIAFCLHILGFFTFLVVLWVMGDRGDAGNAFTDIEDNNNWGSPGAATLVGMASGQYLEIL